MMGTREGGVGGDCGKRDAGRRMKGGDCGEIEGTVGNGMRGRDCEERDEWMGLLGT